MNTHPQLILTYNDCSPTHPQLILIHNDYTPPLTHNEYSPTMISHPLTHNEYLPTMIALKPGFFTDPLDLNLRTIWFFFDVKEKPAGAAAPHKWTYNNIFKMV